MPKIKLRNIWLVLVLCMLQFREFTASSTENKDFIDINQSYLKHNGDNVQNKSHKQTGNNSSIFISGTTVTSLSLKRQITRKQHEIINMVWRKTKLFLDVEDTTVKAIATSIWKQNDKKNRTLTTTVIKDNDPKMISTKSPVRNQHNANINSKKIIGQAHISKDFNVSILDLQTHNPVLDEIKRTYFYPKIIRTTWFPDMIMGKSSTSAFNNDHLLLLYDTSEAESEISSNEFNKDMKQLHILNNTEIHRIKKEQSFTTGTNSATNSNSLEHIKKTTLFDKIKFFEIYDSLTPNPNTSIALEFDYYDTVQANSKTKQTDFNQTTYVTKKEDEKILLEHVDQGSHEHKEAKLSKKHIQGQNSDANLLPKYKGNWILRDNVAKTKFIESKSMSTNLNSAKANVHKNTVANGTAQWSEYSFAAVFIYKPSKIHCDAAGISEHWLIASGSCLSRLDKNPNGEGRTAFVAYCGVNWWQPGRVTYVKQSIVHPSFHPKDNTRRYLFNVGVIEVVTSMSVCTGWLPVNLMSHQFGTSQGETEALAVGWGLDRFDVRYSSTILPRNPLMLYKGKLYSDSCPGLTDLQKTKELDSGGGIKNVYCLSLPPYFVEKSDPVHGGLLLVGGKLFALYLQEERRPLGAQSAQYTGIWRLLPWIADVARETKDLKTSFIDY